MKKKKKKISLFKLETLQCVLLVDNALFVIRAIQFAFIEPFQFKNAIKWLQKLNEDQKDL